MQIMKKSRTIMPSLPSGLAIGGIASLFVTLAAAGIMAKLTENGGISESGIGYGVMGILFIASLVGSSAANMKARQQKLLVCLLSGAVYYVILLSMTALFFGGKYKGVGVTALLVFAGCMLPVFVRGGGKRRGKRFSR